MEMGDRALTGLPIQGAILDKDPTTFVRLMIFAGSVMTWGGFLVGLVRIRRGGVGVDGEGLECVIGWFAGFLNVYTLND